MPDHSSVLSGPKLGQLIYADVGAKYLNAFRRFLRSYDALVQGAVLSRALTSPPMSPSDGDAYIVKATATGDWAGHEDEIAVYRSGLPDDDEDTTAAAWEFYPPKEGMILWDANGSEFVFHDGVSWDELAVGGGGGNVTSTGALGSEPGSPNAGDLYLPTNAPVIERYSGSVWERFGPITKLTAPVDGDFSWHNQGGASVTATNGLISLNAPTSATDNARLRYKAVTAPYVVTALFKLRIHPNNYTRSGLAWFDGTKIVIAGIAMDSTGYRLYITKMTNATTPAGSNYLERNIVHSQDIWIQIEDNSTNRITRWSVDGHIWEDLHTVGRTDFLTPTSVGFCINNINSTYPAAMVLASWKQT